MDSQCQPKLVYFTRTTAYQGLSPPDIVLPPLNDSPQEVFTSSPGLSSLS